MTYFKNIGSRLLISGICLFAFFTGSIALGGHLALMQTGYHINLVYVSDENEVTDILDKRYETPPNDPNELVLDGIALTIRAKYLKKPLRFHVENIENYIVQIRRALDGSKVTEPIKLSEILAEPESYLADDLVEKKGDSPDSESELDITAPSLMEEVAFQENFDLLESHGDAFFNLNLDEIQKETVDLFKQRMPEIEFFRPKGKVKIKMQLKHVGENIKPVTVDLSVIEELLLFYLLNVGSEGAPTGKQLTKFLNDKFNTEKKRRDISTRLRQLSTKFDKLGASYFITNKQIGRGSVYKYYFGVIPD